VVIDQAGSIRTGFALHDRLRRSRVLTNLLLQDARPAITQLHNEEEAMKTKIGELILVVSASGCISMAQSALAQSDTPSGHEQSP